MEVVRHPKLAGDIRQAARHYAEISPRLVESFWGDLDEVFEAVISHPWGHHFDASGLRRANLRKFPYHLLYEVDEDSLYLVVLRHDKRRPSYGLHRVN